MKQIFEPTSLGCWCYTEDPFPRYVCEIRLDGEIRGRGCIPVERVTMVPLFTVSRDKSLGLPNYKPEFASRTLAEAEQYAAGQRYAAIRKETRDALPDHKFLLRETHKGNPKIVLGEDKLHRDAVLLFAGVTGGYRGGCKLETTGTEVLRAYARTARKSRLEAVVVLRPGEIAGLRAYGRHSDGYVAYANEGGELKKAQLSDKEWEYYSERGK